MFAVTELSAQYFNARFHCARYQHGKVSFIAFSLICNFILKVLEKFPNMTVLIRKRVSKKVELSGATFA
jgi:hypothetical protein